MDKMGKYIIGLAVFVHLFAAACTYTQKVRDGKFAFERKQYAVAIPMLKKEYSKAKTRLERGKIAFLLAESFKATGQQVDAIDWYRVAYDNQYGIEALKANALALKQAERYSEAIEAFRLLGLEIGSPYEYRKEIEACEKAIQWRQLAFKPYEIEIVSFNSRAADYAPQLYKDNQLVFTSDRKLSDKDPTYNWTGRSFSNLFVVNLESRQVTPFEPELNTVNNEGLAVFNANYSEVYFTRCFGGKLEDSYCKLMMSKWDGNSWSEPSMLPFVKENINYGQVTISKDGKTMYFDCNDPEGWGGSDIWMSQKVGNEWSTPRLLGRSINTNGNERFPFLDADTLYFASDTHIGMGGFDIFRSYKVNSNWIPAENLQTPINSGADDFGYIVDHKTARNSQEIEQLGYFTSSREGGDGKDDIYRFIKKVPPPPRPISLEDSLKKVEKPLAYKMILDGYVLEKIYEVPNNPSSRVLGRKPLVGAKVRLAATTGERKDIEVGEDGYFSIDLTENTDYRFLASKSDYLTSSENFSTKDIARNPNVQEQRFEVEIVLEKIFINQEIVLENIYYDFDKWDIRDDAKPTLDKLASDLRLNPNIIIELSSHTDCRGNDRYNQQLSQRRAQSAVEYLISKGISPERMIAMGYGEAVLRANCVCARCTEEEHQLNRRTAFKIVN